MPAQFDFPSMTVTPKLHRAVCIFFLMLAVSPSVMASHGNSNRGSESEVITSSVITSSPALSFNYDWNLSEESQPLLSLPLQINSGLEMSLTYPMDHQRFPVFQSLEFDALSHRYVVQVLSSTTGQRERVELVKLGSSEKYVSSDGSDLYLTDNRGVKVVGSHEGTEYTFVRFTDGIERCVRIKTLDGSLISLVYSRDHKIHGLVDSFGRAVRFNYEKDKLVSVTQTWTVNEVAFNKTWTIEGNQVKLAHAASNEPVVASFVKPIPNNAATTQYTAAMASSDQQLAAIFGGRQAVAAANSYEPAALGQQYPIYRGDLFAADGHLIRGHLSYAMHLYGNAEGTGDSALYVPAGFAAHSSEPGPTDAAVTFYYPRLGKLTDVTLAVFHVAHFAIRNEGDRIRIGDIGGPGGSVAGYKHSHIEFYKGNTGLPSAAAREHLRIDPSKVFSNQ